MGTMTNYDHLYYLLGVACIIKNITELFNINKEISERIESKNLMDSIKGIMSKLKSREEKDIIIMQGYLENYMKYVMSQLIYLPLALYPIIGIFTFQGILFITIMLFNILIKSPIERKITEKPIYPAFVATSIMGTILVTAFTIVNAYYLHIDLYKKITNLF